MTPLSVGQRVKVDHPKAPGGVGRVDSVVGGGARVVVRGTGYAAYYPSSCLSPSRKGRRK